jgi:tetratricopeptide (TPR) repeat protein
MRRVVLATVFVSLLPARWLAAAVAPIDEGIRFLEDRVKRDPDDFIAQNQLATRYLRKLRETGDYTWLSAARRAAERSLATVPAAHNLSGLAALAQSQLAAHRFPEAVASAQKLSALAPGKSVSFAILGDALLEHGDRDRAKAAYEKMERIDPASIETHSRRAHLALLSGNVTAARDQFVAARSAAREMVPEVAETVAWCDVQLGALAFSQGNWVDAERCYERALKAYPDYYSALDHLAEVGAAQEDYGGALVLYQRLAARLPRPEFFQAIGDLLAFQGKLEAAKRWHDRALTAYLKSVEQGEVHFFHHLASFFSDVREQPAEATKYARRDLELRHTGAAHEMLAWALYRGGEFEKSVAEIKLALSSGERSPHLFYHAAMIFSAAGDLKEGQRYLRETVALNPRYNAFHVHR